jgi:hypothetical protein
MDITALNKITEKMVAPAGGGGVTTKIEKQPHARAISR